MWLQITGGAYRGGGEVTVVPRRRAQQRLGEPHRVCQHLCQRLGACIAHWDVVCLLAVLIPACMQLRVVHVGGYELLRKRGFTHLQKNCTLWSSWKRGGSLVGGSERFIAPMPPATDAPTTSSTVSHRNLHPTHTPQPHCASRPLHMLPEPGGCLSLGANRHSFLYNGPRWSRFHKIQNEHISVL